MNKTKIESKYQQSSYKSSVDKEIKCRKGQGDRMQKGGLTKLGKGVILLVVLIGIIMGTAIIRDRRVAISTSVGIIGGADGPTAIFVTAKPSPLLSVIIIVGSILLVAGIVTVIMLIVKNKIKK